MRLPNQMASPTDQGRDMLAAIPPDQVDASIFGFKVPVLDDIIGVAKPIACAACEAMPPGPAKAACLAACALV